MNGDLHLQRSGVNPPSPWAEREVLAGSPAGRTSTTTKPPEVVVSRAGDLTPWSVGGIATESDGERLSRTEPHCRTGQVGAGLIGVGPMMVVSRPVSDGPSGPKKDGLSCPRLRRCLSRRPNRSVLRALPPISFRSLKPPGASVCMPTLSTACVVRDSSARQSKSEEGGESRCRASSATSTAKIHIRESRTGH
jgi:hypothetical protein